MARQFARLTTAAAIALPLVRLGRLLQVQSEGPPWELVLITAAVLGGIGILPGAVVGGLLLGIIESLGAGYIGDITGGFLGSHYQDVFAFAVLILVLVFRPSGLLGERVADRA